MPITRPSLDTTPYLIALPNYMNVRNDPVVGVHTGAVRYRNEHIHYPAAEMRVASAITAPTLAAPQASVGGAYNAAGDTYFLPYDNDHITSIRVPNPPPGAVVQFVTANLSGCRFFVDTITGSTDLMLYHANTRQHGASPLEDADAQSANASNILNQMLVDARNDLAPLGLVAAAACTKSTYLRPAGMRERTLAFAGYEHADMHDPFRPRDRPTFSGGCAVVGFVVGGGWQFWYQNWGSVSYRDGSQVVHRRFRSDKTVLGAVHNQPCTVLGVGQIY